MHTDSVDARSADCFDDRPIKSLARGNAAAMLVTDAINLLIAEAEDEGLRAAAIRNKENQWGLHARHLAEEGVTTLGDVNKPVVKRSLRRYRDTPIARSGEKRKTSSVLTHVVHVKTLWKRAYAYYLIPHDIMQGVSLPRADDAYVRIGTDDEIEWVDTAIERYFDVAYNPDMRWSRTSLNLVRQKLRARLAYYFAVSSGLRRAEIVGANVEDVILDRNVIALTSTKGRTTREVPLSPETIEVFRLLLAKRPANLDTRRLMVGEMGDPLSAEGCARQLERIMDWGREQGYPIPHLTMHSFRHKAINAMLQKNPEHARLMAGHKSVLTTHRVYGHTTTDDIRKTHEETDILARLARKRTVPEPAPVEVRPPRRRRVF